MAHFDIHFIQTRTMEFWIAETLSRLTTMNMGDTVTIHLKDTKYTWMRVQPPKSDKEDGKIRSYIETLGEKKDG